MATEEMRLAVKLLAVDQTKAAFGSLNQSLNGLKSTVLAVAGTLVSALALKESIASMSRMGDTLDDLRDRFGLSAQAASMWNVRATVAGLGTSEFASALDTMNRKLIDGLPTLGTSENVFTRWGVAVQDAQGVILPTQGLLENIGKAFRDLGSEQLRNAAAQDIFGRGGTKLLETLTDNSAQMREFLQAAQEWGGILGEDVVDSIESFNKEMRFAGLQMDFIKLAIGRFLLPFLRQLMTAFRQAAGMAKAFGEALRAPLGIIKSVVERIGAFIAQIKSQGLVAAVTSLASDLVSKIGEVLGEVSAWVTANLPKWIAAFAELVIGSLVWFRTTGWPQLVGFLEARVPAFAKWITDSIPEWLANLGKLIGAVVRWFIGTFVPDFAGAIAGTIPKLSEWKDNMVRWFTQEGAPALAIGALDLGVGIVGGIINGLADLGTKMLDSLNETIRSVVPEPIRVPFEIVFGDFGKWLREHGFQLPNLDPRNVIPPPRPSGIGGLHRLREGATIRAGGRMVTPEEFGGLFPGLGGQLFAHGGIVTRPTLGLLGESGPEAVVPLGRGGGFGVTINGGIHVHGSVDSRERVRQLASEVSEEILRALSLGRNVHWARGGLT